MNDDTTAITRAQHTKTNKTLGVLLGLFGVIGPVASAYIGYRQAKVEASVENKKTQDESAAGYKVLASPMNDVMKILGEQSYELAEMKAEIAALKKNQSSPLTPPTTLRGLMGGGLGGIGVLGSGSGAGMSLPPPPLAEAPAAPQVLHLRPILRPLPKTLQDVVQQQAVTP
jgi:hypothetical protein